MILHVEGTYESGMLKLKESLPIPEHTTIIGLIKSPLGTRSEDDAWRLIQDSLAFYATTGPFAVSEALTSHVPINRSLLEVWEAADDHHLNDASSQWQSGPMRDFFSRLRKVATTDSPVLILAESGTEKEVAALAIHKRSSRKANSFVAIKCGGIPENLLAEELLRFEKRVSAGGDSQRAGGTLFLDDIDTLPIALQMRLLKLMRGHTFEQLGAKKEIQIDIRVIAATSVDLLQAVREGRFLEDLYYHLTVVTLKLAPLRERREDLLVMAQDFLQKHASAVSKNLLRFSKATVATIASYEWPGNVRELENTIKRAVIMADTALLTPRDLQLQSPVTSVRRLGLKEARAALDRDLIKQSHERHQGNVSQMAAELGVSRPTLYDLMAKAGITAHTV